MHKKGKKLQEELGGKERKNGLTVEVVEKKNPREGELQGGEDFARSVHRTIYSINKKKEKKWEERGQDKCQGAHHAAKMRAFYLSRVEDKQKKKEIPKKKKKFHGQESLRGVGKWKGHLPLGTGQKQAKSGRKPANPGASRSKKRRAKKQRFKTGPILKKKNCGVVHKCSKGSKKKGFLKDIGVGRSTLEGKD